MKKIERNAFTLFELLVSISIIGILIAIASFSFSEAQKKARDSRRFQDIKAISTAAEQYYSMSGGVYPNDKTVAAFTFGGSALFSSFPTDPKGGTYVYTYTPVGGGAFPASPADYCVCADLEKTTTGNANAVTCNAATFVANSRYYCIRSQQ